MNTWKKRFWILKSKHVVTSSMPVTMVTFIGIFIFYMCIIIQLEFVHIVNLFDYQAKVNIPEVWNL